MAPEHTIQQLPADGIGVFGRPQSNQSARQTRGERVVWPNQARAPKLVDQVRLSIRARHYSKRTEESYVYWIKRFIFARNEILVRDGKGRKDRVTMLPKSLKKPLEEHLRRVKAVHEKDLAEGCGRVPLPDALDRKYPQASREWRWQWVFPQEHRWVNSKTGEQGRHHVDESILQKAFKQAVAKVGLTKRATCHTLRHPFAT